MFLAVMLLASFLLLIFTTRTLRKSWQLKRTVPVSVNYHFTRKCNAACTFCFHTAKTSHVCSEEQARHGLRLLKRAGMKKINFAGGEPFLYPKLLGNMVKFRKDDHGLQSVSIVSNGSKITQSFLSKHRSHIDILAISCDSFNRETNVRLGRMDQGKDYDNVTTLSRIAVWCKEFGIMFKLNSVICKENFDEDMAQHIATLDPFRWKVFQVLIVSGENDSEDTLRNATELRITDEQFESFCSKHSHLKCLVPEPNRLMKSSYLILDEYMRFLDKDKGLESASILDVGVNQALSEVHWDEEAFHKRGGLYNWGREAETVKDCGGSIETDKLEW